MAQQEAVILEKPGVIQIGKREVPEITDPHYVKLQIKATGICGSDVHYYTHGAIGDFVLKAPMVLGHESSGVVVEVGEKVKSVKVGDRVAIEPGVPSRYSVETMSGNYNLCPYMQFAATPPYDGTLVKYYLAPEDFVYKLSDELSFEEGALAEPMSVGVHANKLAGTRYGSKVLVSGAGPVGLLAGAVARSFGATELVFVDVFEEKLERTKQFGATHTVSGKLSEADLVSEVIKVLGGVRPDIVLECSGAQPAIRAGVKACRPGGHYVQVGMGKDDVNFPISDVNTKELNFHGCFRYKEGDFNDSVSLLSSGKINVKPLISHRFTFEQAPEAYKFNAEHGGEVVKTVITGPE
ncbi:XYL2 (YLR070C) [Zygosaccharomyces parabailii]|nr:XYL2 (YLR070C) [Zygosaccharomyces parabailii]